MTRESTSHSEQCKKLTKYRKTQQSTSDTWIDQSERTFPKLGDTPKQNCGTQKPRGSTSHSEPSQNWGDTSKLQGTDAREFTSLGGHCNTRENTSKKEVSLILSLPKKIHDFRKINIIVRNEVNASLFSRSVNFLLFIRCEPFGMLDHSSGQIFLLQYSVSLSASNPHVSSWWFFVEHFESCHTDPGLRQSLVSINIPIIDGCLMKNVNASFRLSLDMNLIQRYRRIVVRNIEFRSRGNMIPAYGISHNVPEIQLSFDIWICISGFFFFF